MMPQKQGPRRLHAAPVRKPVLALRLLRRWWAVLRGRPGEVQQDRGPTRQNCIFSIWVDSVYGDGETADPICAQETDILIPKEVDSQAQVHRSGPSDSQVRQLALWGITRLRRSPEEQTLDEDTLAVTEAELVHSDTEHIRRLHKELSRILEFLESGD